MQKAMNVVFIMTDQQRYDTIFGTGPEYPNMQRLRRESVSFNNFYISAAACVPSRACFLTGRNAWNLNMCGNGRFVMDNASAGTLDKSWMQVLREHGYSCVSVGKTHMIHAGSYHIPVALSNSFGGQEGWNHFNPAPSPERDECFYDIQVAKRACDALDVLYENGPFSMFVGFHAPHEPYVMPEKYLGFCVPDDISPPHNRSLSEYESKSASYRRRFDHFKRLFGNCITDDESVKRAVAGYYCSLKMIDDCIGTIMQKLESLGALNETLIVFTSDHGELLGEHYLFNKNATAYDGEIRIPFMLRFPDGHQAGRSVSNMACAIDFFPTVMDILGIEPDLPLPGYSLVPCINQGSDVRDSVLIWHYISSLTLVTEGKKLMYCPEDEDGELYDLDIDGDEMNNLWHDPEATGLKADMLRKMLHHRLLNDRRASILTEREKRLHREVRASHEPEVR